MQLPNRGNIIQIGKKRYHIISSPTLNRDENGYTASALLFDRRIETVVICWKFTPIFEKALSMFCSADERDETVIAILEDIWGAAEWENPQILRYITPEPSIDDSFTENGSKYARRKSKSNYLVD